MASNFNPDDPSAAHSRPSRDSSTNTSPQQPTGDEPTRTVLALSSTSYNDCTYDAVLVTPSQSDGRDVITPVDRGTLIWNSFTPDEEYPWFRWTWFNHIGQTRRNKPYKYFLYNFVNNSLYFRPGDLFNRYRRKWIPLPTPSGDPSI